MKDLETKEIKNRVSVRGNALTLLGEEIKVGDIAPEFTVTDNGGKDVKFSDYKGKTIVLAIFPSIDTPVCANQARTFNKKATELSENIVILTISKDLPFALGRFCAAEGINNIHTLSDYKFSEFGLKYGFLIKENRLLARGTVIIDPSGVVKYVEHVPDIIQEPDYDKALEVLKGM